MGIAWSPANSSHRLPCCVGAFMKAETEERVHNIEVTKSAVSLKISSGIRWCGWTVLNFTSQKFPQISREHKARFSKTIVKGKENNSERKGRLRMWLMVCGCVSGSLASVWEVHTTFLQPFFLRFSSEAEAQVIDQLMNYRNYHKNGGWKELVRVLKPFYRILSFLFSVTIIYIYICLCLDCTPTNMLL